MLRRKQFKDLHARREHLVYIAAALPIHSSLISDKSDPLAFQLCEPVLLEHIETRQCLPIACNNPMNARSGDCL